MCKVVVFNLGFIRYLRFKVETPTLSIVWDADSAWVSKDFHNKSASNSVKLNQEYRNTSISGMNYEVFVGDMFHWLAFVQSYLCSAYPFALITEYLTTAKKEPTTNGHQRSSWSQHFHDFQMLCFFSFTVPSLKSNPAPETHAKAQNR